MFVRVTVARYDPTREEEVDRYADDEIIPSYRAMPGFQGYGGGVDREAGRMVVVTAWDTREHAQYPPGFLAKIGPRFAELDIALELSQVFELSA